jgi:rod shape-determining protein MreC
MTRASGRVTLFFILAGISLALLILSSSGQMAPVEGAARVATRPFLNVFNELGRQATNVLQTVNELGTLRTLNRQLKSRVDTLTIDNLRLTEVEAENQQLRELLRFKQLNPTYDFRGGQVIARVISQAQTNYLSSLSIDLGSEQGIARGMPVVTEQGLVGRIDKVGPNSATVLLLIDPSSGVQALVKRNRAVGVVNGRAGGLPVMEYIPMDADISAGDEIITSGLGGNFPKNVTIGQIVEVIRHDYDMYQQAVIRPTVNFDRLEFVLIITNFKPLPGQPEELESVG